jgi:hypothetical protein
MNIIIRPLGRGRFAASLGQRLLCKSKTPLLTAARILQAEGAPDDTPISMTHEGSSVVAMRSTIGKAAGLIVEETDTKGPKFKAYRPMSAQVPRQRVRQEVRKARETGAALGAILMPVQLSLFAPHLLGQHLV